MKKATFEKLATGIISGLQTMEDLRRNKTSLFDSYPVLAEGENWNNLVIFARDSGLQPVCNHIRVARNKAQFLNILANRGYVSVGEVKYLRPIINKYVKNNGVDFDYKGILQSWKEYVKNLADNEYNQALSDYTYNNILKEVSKLVFNNPTFKETIVSAIGAGLINMENPVQFVRDWYSYTDFEGNLLVPVNYINNDNIIIAARWEYKRLTTTTAITTWENALRNVKKCFKAGKLGRKYTPLKRVHHGALTGQYWSVVVDDKGRFAKGDKMGYDGVTEEFMTTLADRNKEVQE